MAAGKSRADAFDIAPDITRRENDNKATAKTGDKTQEWERNRGYRQVNMRMPSKTVRALKVASFETGLSHGDIVAPLLEKWLIGEGYL